MDVLSHVLGIPKIGGGGGVQITIPGPLAPNPTLGSELLTNADFSVWTSDNPDGYTIIGESDSDPMVTEVGAGGAAGTGMARLFSSATNERPLLRQTKSIVGQWVQGVATLDTQTSGVLRLRDASANLQADFNQTGSCLITGLSGSNNWDIMGGTAPTDVVVADVGLKIIDLSSMFDVHDVGFLPRSIAAPLTWTPNTQIGVALYVDDNNWIAAHLTTGSRIVLIKRVGGTYATIKTVNNIPYVEGRILELVYDPDAEVVSVKYNLVTIIPEESVTDAVFTTATKVAVMSTYTGNTADSLTVKEKVAASKHVATFVWMSDVHRTEEYVGGTFDEVIEQINVWNPNFVIDTGDIATNGSAPQFADYNNSVAALNMQLYTVPGNHDTDTTGDLSLYDAAGLMRHFVVDVGSMWRLIGLETRQDDDGSITSDELAWLNSQLESAGERSIILCGHYSYLALDASGSVDMDALATQYRIRGFLAGHGHSECVPVTHGNGVITINGPSVWVNANNTPEQNDDGGLVICKVYSDRMEFDYRRARQPFDTYPTHTTPIVIWR